MSKIRIAFLKEKTDTECRELAGHYYRRARRAEKERDQLREQVEALSRDAERYRWLRDPCSGAERAVMYGRGDYGRCLMAYTMLDEAIDAAMQESSHDNQ